MFTNEEIRILQRLLHAAIQELPHDAPEFQLFQKISGIREPFCWKFCDHYFVKAHPLGENQKFICLNCDMVK